MQLFYQTKAIKLLFSPLHFIIFKNFVKYGINVQYKKSKVNPERLTIKNVPFEPLL